MSSPTGKARSHLFDGITIHVMTTRSLSVAVPTFLTKVGFFLLKGRNVAAVNPPEAESPPIGNKKEIHSFLIIPHNLLKGKTV